ncbi:hypothetical protein [Octadecabacter sp. R77987]|uniref:hypothetical protein n=1 Tax=Octadecabacter sp. R77987 TaxID=3093874 RepID=UPI00366AF285
MKGDIGVKRARLQGEVITATKQREVERLTDQQGDQGDQPQRPQRLGRTAMQHKGPNCRRNRHQMDDDHHIGKSRKRPGEPILDFRAGQILPVRHDRNCDKQVNGRDGFGIGFAPISDADADPDLISIGTPDPAWQIPVWVVTHVDLHRSIKVQAFLGLL